VPLSQHAELGITSAEGSGVGQREQPFQHAAGVLELPRRTAQAVGALQTRALPSCKQVDFHFCSNLEECSKTPTDVRTAHRGIEEPAYQYLELLLVVA